MIRVLHFADLTNRYDVSDTIVQHADWYRFQVGICVRTSKSNIAAPVYSPRTPRWVLKGTSRWSIPQTAWRLARLLRAWKSDILHTHNYDQAVIGWLATRMCPKTRLVVGRHYSDSIYRSSSGWKRQTLLALEQAVNRAATRIVVPSRYIHEILTQRQRISPDKISTVHYGFSSEKYDVPLPSDLRRFQEKLGLKGRFVIGNFSRLHEGKGLHFLIEAIAQLRRRWPNLTLLVVGEGPERTALEQLIQDYNLSDVVRLLGWRRDAMTIMAAVDIVVQPTLEEAFSQVMVEALWMRKPLVITDVGGATDIIIDEQNGILIPKSNVTALVSAIERLVSDKPLQDRLGAAGQTYVKKNLAIEKIIPQYEQVYNQVMES